MTKLEYHRKKIPFVFDGYNNCQQQTDKDCQGKNEKISIWNTGTALYICIKLLRLIPHLSGLSFSCAHAVLAIWNVTILNFRAEIALIVFFPYVD